jgi:hypothetical protein
MNDDTDRVSLYGPKIVMTHDVMIWKAFVSAFDLFSRYPVSVFLAFPDMHLPGAPLFWPEICFLPMMYALFS